MSYLRERLPLDDKLPAPETKPQTPPMDEVGRKLMEAARIIRERGWCRFTEEDKRGRVCLHGAINKAVGDYGPTNDAAWHRVRDQLRRDGIIGSDSYEYGLAPWNNAPERTADDVVSALVAAAQRPAR